MRCAGRAKKHISQKPGGKSLIWRIAPSPNGRTAEAIKLQEKYPAALDKEAAQSRIADLKRLLSLSGQSGVEVRKLYAAVYGSLAERGLLYEAMGDVDMARENYLSISHLIFRIRIYEFGPQ